MLAGSDLFSCFSWDCYLQVGQIRIPDLCVTLALQLLIICPKPHFPRSANKKHACAAQLVFPSMESN